MSQIEELAEKIGKAFTFEDEKRRFSSILYLPKSQTKITCTKLMEGETIVLSFSSNEGKFGTDEYIDEFRFTPEQLLEVLRDHEDKYER